MKDIYETLSQINQTATNGPTFLPAVGRLALEETEDTSQLTVLLSPLGFETRLLEESAVCELLYCVLTTLGYWHGTNYCHGDVRWHNIVCVSGDAGAHYWMLIDFDEARRPITKQIDWKHPCQGMKLTFWRDVYQVGRLLDRFFFRSWGVSDELKELRDLLLSTDHGASAQAVLAHPLMQAARTRTLA